MTRLFRAIAVLAGVLIFAPAAYSQSVAAGPSRALITQTIDESNRVPLAHAVHPAANAADDRGRVDDDLALPHLLLQLQRPPEQEQALDQLIDQLHDPSSPNFHHWLTATEFGARFGLAAQDLATITAWLQQHGFEVNFTYPNGTLIDFSGTAGQVREAFHTELHRLSVNGEAHIANMSAPEIPAALAGAIVGIAGLNDFKPQRQYRPRVALTTSQGNTLVAPADLATIYNFNPLFSQGISGQGQTIAVVEDTNVYSTADWSTFRATFGLSGYPGSFTQIHPAASGGSTCSDPGTNDDEGEAILDAEWASAAAPSAAIVLASCANFGDGLLIAVQNLINGTSPPPLMSISYGQCEAESTDGASYNAAYQQAVAEGISVFVAAGDWGAALCDASDGSPPAATHGIGVNALASSPYDVAVGGTDFADVLAPTFGFGHGDPTAYWSATNGSTSGSALSYVPEIPWNDSCANNLTAIFVSGSGDTNSFCNNAAAIDPPPQGDGLLNIIAGSGGPSTTYAKPAWQTGLLGVPGDGHRDLPDVSLFAGNGIWGHAYVFCWSDPVYIPNNGGAAACGSDPSTWSAAGGTSFASPILAGIQALVDQDNGGRQGNPNPVYYALAAAEYGSSGNSSCLSTVGGSPSSSCVFYDIAEASNDVPCTGMNDCYLPSGQYGVLSTSDSTQSAAYLALGGWDFATGIGTVNAANLVHAWSTRPVVFTVDITGSGTVTTDGGITCSTPTCTFAVAKNAQITFSATAAPGWTFAGWIGGDCTGSITVCVYPVSLGTTVTAVFTQGLIPLFVTAGQGGYVTSQPAGILCGDGHTTCSANFPINSTVSVTGNPDPGWIAFEWQGSECEGGGGTCSFQMRGVTTETMTFGGNLNVTFSGQGTITSTSSSGFNCSHSPCFPQIYPAGTQMILNASPANGWAFAGWASPCGGTGTCTVTMNGNQSVAASFVSTVVNVDPGPYVNTWGYVCTDTSNDNLNGAIAGTAAWSTTTSSAATAHGKIGAPGPGDLIEITNICLGDITITTDHLVLTNHNDFTMAPLLSNSFSDGIAGLVEVSGAKDVAIRNLALSSSSSDAIANLYVHDLAAVTAQHDFFSVATTGTGIEISGKSQLLLIDSHISIAAQAAQYGAHVEDGSDLTMGLPDGSQPDRIDGVFGFSPGLATIALRGQATLNVYNSSIVASEVTQIRADEKSSIHLSSTDIPVPGTTTSSFEPAVQVHENSSLLVDRITGQPAPSISGYRGVLLLDGLSNAILNSATLTSSLSPLSTVEASANASLVLAGGNTIFSDGYGGSAAIQIDHSSSLIQEAATRFGYSANAPDTITGKGNILMQSSTDLGQGQVGSAFGLVWNGPIAVGQNSAIRLQGGVHITGSVQISAASNGYLNCNNAGGTCSAAGAANQVDGSIQCLELTSSPDNPSVHISNPTMATPTTEAANSFGTGGFAATSEAANTCLNF